MTRPHEPHQQPSPLLPQTPPTVSRQHPTMPGTDTEAHGILTTPTPVAAHGGAAVLPVDSIPVRRCSVSRCRAPPTSCRLQDNLTDDFVAAVERWRSEQKRIPKLFFSFNLYLKMFSKKVSAFILVNSPKEVKSRISHVFKFENLSIYKQKFGSFYQEKQIYCQTPGRHLWIGQIGVSAPVFLSFDWTAARWSEKIHLDLHALKLLPQPLLKPPPPWFLLCLPDVQLLKPFVL